MTEIPEIERDGPSVWRLGTPDWGALDTVRQDALPFALWPVGEQALLFHWLDAAVDQGTERVELYVSDRPREVRQQVAAAELWPIEIKVHTVRSTVGLDCDDWVDRLPKTPGLVEAPSDGWSLLDHWFATEQAWLKRFAEETEPYGDFAAIGKFCEIAKDTKLIPPYWIGSFVSIGPGSTIGPGAVIEDGSMLTGEHRIERAHLGAHTYLAPNTDLVDAALHGSELLNLNHRAKVSGLEAFLAGGVQAPPAFKAQRPCLRDRWTALRLYLRWARHGYSSETDFQDLRGDTRPLLQDNNPYARGPWLKQVIAGKLLLFGTTPRPPETIASLPVEWQTVLKRSAPGAFSYADVMGAHEIGEEEEVMHCIYQASAPDGHCRTLFEKWLEELD